MRALKALVRAVPFVAIPLVMTAGCAHAPKKSGVVSCPPAVKRPLRQDADPNAGSAAHQGLEGESSFVEDSHFDSVPAPSVVDDQTLIQSDSIQSEPDTVHVKTVPTRAAELSVANFEETIPTEFDALLPRQERGRPAQIRLDVGTVPGTVDSCGFAKMKPYLGLAAEFQPESLGDASALPPEVITPWWANEVQRQTRLESTPVWIDLEMLMVRALANSKYVQALAELPLIREKSIVEAEAEFDVTTFMETRFNRPSEPVGNQLTVGPGGANRYRQEDFTHSGGVARKTIRGGRVQLAQQIGMYSNNSTFIDPEHQGNAQLTLNLTQPLLSGSGKAYNSSLIMLAKLDERIAWDEVSAQLQQYLVDVTETYWQLYLERSRLHQKERHLQRGEAILAELEHRQEVDAVDNQIARARAAVTSRRSELIRAKTSVRNAESRLRGLINDPELYGANVEVVPQERPHCDWLDISVRDAMSQALQSRSEIDQSIQKVRAAGIRLKVAKNELMPVLDFVLETYLSGLRGQNNIGQAWVDQFSVGEPSYSAGMRYEIPINNRAAKSRHDRRRLELRQAMSQFEFNVEELMSEVEIAVREVDTAYAEMLARHEAMLANETDLNYFQKRWQLIPGDDRSASFLLGDILEAQDRVAAEEANFAQAQIRYAMSLVELKRALGILLQSEQIETDRGCNSGLDQLMFHKVKTLVEEVSQPPTETSLPELVPYPVMVEELNLIPVTNQ